MYSKKIKEGIGGYMKRISKKTFRELFKHNPFNKKMTWAFYEMDIPVNFDYMFRNFSRFTIPFGKAYIFEKYGNRWRIYERDR